MADALSGIPHIESVYAVSGERDLVALAFAADMRELTRLLFDLVLAEDSIRAVMLCGGFRGGCHRAGRVDANGDRVPRL